MGSDRPDVAMQSPGYHASTMPDHYRSGDGAHARRRRSAMDRRHFCRDPMDLDALRDLRHEAAAEDLRLSTKLQMIIRSIGMPA